jgi:hypothetical protein
MIGLLSGLWARVLAAGGLVVAILAGLALVFRKGEAAGEAKIKAADSAARDEAIETRKSTDADIDRLSDADIRRRLRDQWGKS